MVAAAVIVLLSVLAPSARGLTSSLSGSGGLLDVRSAELQTPGVLSLTLAGEYYESFDLSDALGAEEAGRYVGLALSGSYGMSTWLEFSGALPATAARWDTGGGALDATGLAGPSVGVKLALPGGGRWFRLAVEGRLGLPVDGGLSVDGPEGEVHLAGGSDVDAEALLLATADFTDHVPLRLHANIGWAFHGDDANGRRVFPGAYPPVPEGGSSSDNDALALRCAVEFPGRHVDLFTEFVGDIIMDRDLVALKENPLTITPAVRVRLGTTWSATGAITFGISGDDRDTPDFDPHDVYPDWRATFAVSLAWPVVSTDSDRDGISDHLDRCPRRPEDIDGFEDDDGCPDLDNDGDGVPDEEDGAPGRPEDVDGFEDEDGVPDLDNDGDGIIDERDMCPDGPEDLDGVEDADGCPESE
jgi:hypothetical protein